MHVESRTNVHRSFVVNVFQSFRSDKSHLSRCSVRKHAVFHRWNSIGRKEGRQEGRKAGRPGKTKPGLASYCAADICHIRRKSHTASEAQTVIARVYNRRALILIVPLPLPRCRMAGFLPRVLTCDQAVSPISHWSPAARLPTYLDGRATWTEPGRWTWTEEGRGAVASRC